MNAYFWRHLVIWGAMALTLPLLSPVLPSAAGTESGAGETVSALTGRLADAEGNDRITLLIRRGEAYRTAGHYESAQADFQAAREEARARKDRGLEAIAAQALGYIRFLQKNPEEAEPLLRSALEAAESLDNPGLTAVSANRLGTVVLHQGRAEAAGRLYGKALDSASRIDDPALTAAIRRNRSRTISDSEMALVELAAAKRTVSDIEDPRERIDLLLEIAAEVQADRYGARGIPLAHAALVEALESAAELDDARRISQAAGMLGALYEGRGRRAEARRLTEQAIESAQRPHAHELLLKWEWQLGRLLRDQGERREAIDAFQRAVGHIEAIRQDIPIEYQDGRSSFRETLAPIYMGLADMLLTAAADETEDQRQQDLLRQARQVVERVKRSEMTDYFRDRCIAARSKGIGTLSDATAVIYPIILEDRLALLVDIGGRLERRTTPVSRTRLEGTVGRLARRLRDGAPFETLAGLVYRWLIDPVAPLLETAGIDTVVYVPDGALRQVPLAALWDGERFVAEWYAVVTVPGLTLLDPAPLARGEMDALIAGMSRPGPVIFDLPNNLWTALRTASFSPRDRGVRGLTVAPAQLKEAQDPAESSPAKESPPEVIDRVKAVLTLPGVDEEIAQLSRSLRGQVLFNEAFQLERFAHQLTESPFRVIHIASHGYFGGSPEQNFIMTYDHRLDMNRLEALIRPKQLAARPVELITLSACQTAEGDDRSPLGLSGVVLKSGARSAMGSLWPVSDHAAQELLPAFYAHLKDPEVTKAEALRRAQLSLLSQDRFRHPFFWSPFILVGNWL